MRNTLWIAGVAAAIAFGCARHDATRSGDSLPAGTGAASQTPEQTSASASRSGRQADRESTAGRELPDADKPPPAQLVSLTGCLQGGEAQTPSAASTPLASSGPPVNRAATGDSGANRFVLRRAKPEPGAGGVGANGAGGSGGPLVGAASDYVLEGSIAELRPHVNQQVRVSARVDPRTTATEPLSSGAPSGQTPGTTAPGVPSTGSTATASPSASNRDANRGADDSGAPLRRLLVESVQLVATSCPDR